MNKNLQRLSGLLILSFLSSCAANTYVSQVEQADLPRLNLQFDVQEVEIIDSRQNQNSDDIKLPIVSKPNSLIKHVPALTTSHKELIEKVIRENTTNSGTSIKAIIDIPDSYMLDQHLEKDT